MHVCSGASAPCAARLKHRVNELHSAQIDANATTGRGKAATEVAVDESHGSSPNLEAPARPRGHHIAEQLATDAVEMACTNKDVA
eukprot:4094848-Prymnesium_polylepis.1